jgi:purine-binding chemotaxis protein CheW
MVNSASEVLKIPPSEIEAPHSVFQEGDLNYITGVGKLHGRLVILLDLSKVLQRGELKRLEEAAEPEREAVSTKSRAPVLSSK